MRCPGWGVVLIALLAGAPLAIPRDPPPPSVPLGPLQREIARLRGFTPAAPGERKLTIPERGRWFLRVRAKLSEFITRQIDLYPDIGACDLQSRLEVAFIVAPSACSSSGDENDSRPRVWAEPWGSTIDRRVFFVAYSFWFGCHGPGCAETVLESYVWQRGPTQLGSTKRAASTLAPGFSGIDGRIDLVQEFSDPKAVWVLVHGTMTGFSGHVLLGAAAVFEISPDAVKTVWTPRRRVFNVDAYSHPLAGRWEIEYTDAQRLDGGLPHSRLLDIYQVDPRARSFRQLVHQPLD